MSVFRLADQMRFLKRRCESSMVAQSNAIAQCIFESPIVVADNVCQYVHELANINAKSRLDAKDIPSLLPPFDSFFVEMRRPLGWDSMPPIWGWLVLSQKTTADGGKIKTLWTNIVGNRCCEFFGGFGDDGWSYIFCLVMQVGGVVWCPCAYAAIQVNAIGELLTAPHWFVPIGLDGKTFGASLAPCLLAISFMNCKNVVITDNAPAVRKKSEQRAYRGPMVRYKTLEIEPMRKVLRTEGRSDELGMKRALHICRGHFATYSADKPLFGRAGAHGNFWIPSHVRGTADQGVILKDYAINSPISNH